MPIHDFNGDGYSDVLWRHDDGTVGVWLGSLAAIEGFAAVSSSLVHVPNDWQIVGTGDFDRDGHSDILWRHENGTVGNWLGADGGHFTVNNPSLRGAPGDWFVAGTGDFNDDGYDDILWRNFNGTIGTWQGGENGQFSVSNTQVAVPNYWQIAGVGDFNADGNSDILWHSDDGWVGTWHGTDNGSFTINAELDTIGVSSVVAVGDFTGDAQSDIIIVDAWSNYSMVPAEDDGGFDLSIYDPFADTGFGTISAVADYDGDGMHDILWRFQNGGLTYWFGVGHVYYFNPSEDGYDVPVQWRVQPNPAGIGFWDY